MVELEDRGRGRGRGRGGRGRRGRGRPGREAALDVLFEAGDAQEVIEPRLTRQEVLDRANDVRLAGQAARHVARLEDRLRAI